MKFQVVFAFLLLIGVCYGRAIGWTNKDGSEQPDIPLDFLQNVKPSRFVPINSALFFRRFEPCQEGYQRDVLGICREVWD
ncbi:uncharacterized protein LOC121731662 [Aricia agestis]|uniref:uncharacterized protein LOC121731662 n=1 Tax=Aricia agestis TaxID=91739 RepID=UPI001C204A70|nr:uncharacterized protein LOC121731662 [Aricia agestis]